jgi:IMP dehydrogenase/GMP reductase
MKMNLKAVADGHLRIPSPLRKGDELVEFFEAYRSMVISLRGRQEDEIHRIEKAIASLEGKTGAADLESLQTLRRDMKAALDT